MDSRLAFEKSNSGFVVDRESSKSSECGLVDASPCLTDIG